MNILCKIKFGAHLYGTDTEDSDTDYKGIYMPGKEDILLGRVKKSIRMDVKADNVDGKNTKDAVDCEFYSLQYFLKLLCQGETAAIDMIHAPYSMIEIGSPIWTELQFKRSDFYTKKLDAFVGYCKRQADKYGIKGSRINAAEHTIEVLLNRGVFNPKFKLTFIWDRLITHAEVTEHVKIIEPSPNGVRQIMVCGKILQETQTITYSIEILRGFISKYGKRAKLARENQGIDWKAVSHALRAAYQLIELYQTGDIKFPLANCRMLLKIKKGELDYCTDVAPVLEAAIATVEDLSENSVYPDTVDVEYWDKWLCKTIEREVFV